MDLPEFSGIHLRSVHQSGNFGDFPLHVALWRGNVEEVECLLAAGADPNVKGERGYTPLLIAEYKHLPEIASLLINAGAADDVPNDDGTTVRELRAKQA